MPDPDLRSSLKEWIEQVRSKLASTAAGLGIPTTVAREVPVVRDVRDDGKGFRTERLSVSRTVLTDRTAALTIFGALDEVPALSGLRMAMRALHEQHGANLAFWSFGFQSPLARDLTPHPAFDERPDEWLIANVAVPLGHAYLDDLSDLAEGDAGLLDGLVDEALGLLHGDALTAVDRIPVAGFRTDLELTSGTVSLVPLTELEMGRWTNEAVVGGTREQLVVHEPYAPAFTHELRGTFETPKREQPQSDHLARRTLVALQLLGFEPASLRHGTQLVEPAWASPGRFGFPTGLGMSFARRDISQNEFENAVELAAQIPWSALSSPASARDIAIHRYHQALRREDYVDRLLDMVISLEALLLPKVRSTTYRLALNGSLWIANPQEREETFRNIKTIYSARSDIVHGETFPHAAELKALAATAGEYARRGLLHALSAGWPDARDFERTALGIAELYTNER